MEFSVFDQLMEHHKNKHHNLFPFLPKEYTPAPFLILKEMTYPSMWDSIHLVSMVSHWSIVHHTLSFPSHTVTPTITNLTYHEGNDSHTLTCVSTGSPATTVCWTKDKAPLTSDYTISQTVIDRSTSTYSNVLTVSPKGAAGIYNCTVSNDLGSDSRVVEALGELSLHFSCFIIVTITAITCDLTWAIYRVSTVL